MQWCRWGVLGMMILLLGSIAAAQSERLSHVGLVTDVGKVDDRTFNEFAYTGMMRAVKSFGLKSAFIETQQPTDYEKKLSNSPLRVTT